MYPEQLTSNSFYLRTGKRLVDIFLSIAGLVFLSPLFLALAALVKITSPGRVLYRQQRVGKDGCVFAIVKFRSMFQDHGENGPTVTSARDPRITPLGRWLRYLKLDELPQLWNVLVGDMSIVGPRPELPSYVAAYNACQKRVLAVRPGLTDDASLAFRWEEELLSQSHDPEQFYRDVVLPRKLELSLEYVAKASLARDFSLIVRTLLSITKRPSPGVAITS